MDTRPGPLPAVCLYPRRAHRHAVARAARRAQRARVVGEFAALLFAMVCAYFMICGAVAVFGR